MNDELCKYAPREIRRLDVETPLGLVHLAGFNQKPDHRAVIYRILSDYCGEPVTGADLKESSENPRPLFDKLDFDVNWTHSADFCVLAFGDRGSKGKMRIGVDLERLSPKRLHLAGRFFSEVESSRINALMKGSADSVASVPASAAEREFFRLWCRKEAFYKCVGGEFFEGALRRSMLDNPVCAERYAVHFVDLDGAVVASPVECALCIAVGQFEA